MTPAVSSAAARARSTGGRQAAAGLVVRVVATMASFWQWPRAALSHVPPDVVPRRADGEYGRGNRVRRLQALTTARAHLPRLEALRRLYLRSWHPGTGRDDSRCQCRQAS